MDPFLTPTQLKKLRVVDLKEKLAALGYPLNGLKADLIKRLSDYYASQQKMEVAKPVVAQESALQPTIPPNEMIDASNKQTGQDTVNSAQLNRVKEVEQNYEAHHEISHQEEGSEPSFASMEMTDDNKQTEQDANNPEENDGIIEDTETYGNPSEITLLEKEPVSPSMEMIDTSAKITEQKSSNFEELNREKEDEKAYETTQPISQEEKETVPALPISSTEVIGKSTNQTEMSTLDSEEIDRAGESEQTFKTLHSISNHEKETAPSPPIPSVETMDVSSKQLEQNSSNSEEKSGINEGEQSCGTPQEISDLENLLTEALQAKQSQNEVDVVDVVDPSKMQKEAPEISKAETKNVTSSNQINGSAQQKKNLSRNEKKRLRKKKKKIEKQKSHPNEVKKATNELDDDDNLDIEYIEDEVPKDPIYYQYIKVFEKFKTSGSEDLIYPKNDNEIVDRAKQMLERKKPVELELKEDHEKNDGEPKLSKRKLKQLTRMTVADLKQKVSHPELVEMHDVTARDPILLLHLKSTRNSVPVPRHWCYKRKYLQGKRGFDKPAFKLPDFIRKTGIMEIRQALQEKEDAKSLKARQREKIRPKLGKIDIDYQKLHDAFFKWQTKPKMTIHGDIYYEGKEFETRLKEKKPGDLSVELRVALGMPTGPNGHKCPPPWIIAMQRYGPPPSYPNLKIPGLNAKIPDGCSFGYHAGGWGKPPVDEYGRPLYGDVFGLSTAQDNLNKEEEVDKSLWGEIESEEEEEEEDEEEEEEEAENDKFTGETDDSGLVTPSEGSETPSGFASMPNGMETPDIIELRKRKIEAEMESNESATLYTIIPEKTTERVGKEMLASTHIYDVTGSLKKGQGVEVALDPNDLEMPVAGLAAKYEKSLKEQQASIAKEDLSDMVAEHAARQKRKKVQDTSKSNKKYKDFKF
ncbi:splicing factor 3B subunit 2-like [Tetranychus urticae]|uniref:SAP domain-containing protein n=1 Tax=Tetranychus urticae TaxID=32264 RepID=T1JSW6_TETUR|nr:splicing factor 3B subunit 2-like [Tetranychus urticae]